MPMTCINIYANSADGLQASLDRLQNAARIGFLRLIQLKQRLLYFRRRVENQQ